MLDHIVIENVFYHDENGDNADGRGLILNGNIPSHHVYMCLWWWWMVGVVMMVMVRVRVCVCGSGHGVCQMNKL